MVNLFALLLLLGFTVGIILLMRKSVLTQRRADLAALARLGTATERANAVAVLRGLRARNITVLAVLVAGAVIAVVLHQRFPSAAGLPLAVAPAGIWVLAVLVFAGRPLPHEFSGAAAQSPQRVSADSTPRSSAMFGPAWGIALPAILLAGTVLGLVVAGILSGPDENGRFRNLHYVSAAVELDSNMVVTRVLPGAGAAGPFPGWYYGIPLLVLLLLGAGLSLWALNSNARRPRMRGENLRGFDNAVRTHVGYLISSGFSAMLCFQAAPLALAAAAAFRSSGANPGYVIGQVYDDAAIGRVTMDPVMGALSIFLAALALILLVVGAILLLRLLGWLGAALRPLHDAATESSPA